MKQWLTMKAYSCANEFFFKHTHTTSVSSLSHTHTHTHFLSFLKTHTHSFYTLTNKYAHTHSLSYTHTLLTHSQINTHTLSLSLLTHSQMNTHSRSLSLTLTQIGTCKSASQKTWAKSSNGEELRPEGNANVCLQTLWTKRLTDIIIIFPFAFVEWQKIEIANFVWNIQTVELLNCWSCAMCKSSEIIFESILTTKIIFWASRSLPKIGLNLKPNHQSQVKLVQIPDTHGT